MMTALQDQYAYGRANQPATGLATGLASRSTTLPDLAAIAALGILAMAALRGGELLAEPADAIGLSAVKTAQAVEDDGAERATAKFGAIGAIY
ncbi:MAG: hypothetical protein GC152_12665 [Alphaproteobacteria bacterium]|nr:hypothetical protein [Alphaproteobacteria bacterium]